MATTNTYLNFDGNCEEAFNFYKSIFGGDFTYLGRFGDMPNDGGHPVSEEDKNKVMHVSLPIGTSVLMGSDTGGEWAPKFTQGNNYAISITAESKVEADMIFNGLAKGGMVTMPLESTFWGDYFGMLTDQYGVHWMMSFNEVKK